VPVQANTLDFSAGKQRAMAISVIIVSWNAKAFLLECIRSILTQPSPTSIEIIVVDNASSDGSPEAVREAFPAVKLIRNKHNYGFAKANNIGIRASKGDYLFLINSDVVVGDRCFGKMIQYMDQHRAVGMLGPRILGSNGRLQRSCMGYPSLWNAFTRALALDSLFPHSRLVGGQLLTFWRHDDTRPVDVINGCFWMLRRSAMERVGLLDERFLIYGEDIDWCKRFNECGWKVVFLHDAEALHHGGASSANAPVKFYLEMQRANYQYWVKHHSRLASCTFLYISLLHNVVRIAGEMARYPFLRHKRVVSTYKIARGLASMNWIVSTLASSKKGLRTAERPSL
jgi:GT2 family glycosyltransferase